MKYINTQLAVVLFLCTIMLSLGCKKEGNNRKLPPETQTGALTIGFKVDGKVYTASGRFNPLSDGFVSFNFFAQDSILDISASNSEQKFYLDVTLKYYIGFSLNSISYARSFPFEASFQDNSNGTISNGSNLYKTNLQYQGKFNIKHFFPQTPQASIVSGTFEMQAINQQGKVINITEGRFDIAD